MGSEVCNSYICIHWSASCHCRLQELSSAQRCHCTHIGECSNTIGFRNDMRLTDLGTNEVVSKSVSLSSFTNHSLLDGVTALIH